jgi:hypothetical protein
VIANFRLTAREWINRRMGLVVCGLTIALPTLLILPNQIHRDPSGVFRGSPGITIENQIQIVFDAILRMFSIWAFVAAISAAFLLCTYLERGWVELLFTKSRRRWTFLITRLATATLIYATSLSIMLLILAAYYGRAGWELIPHGLWRSVLLMTVSFAALAVTAGMLALTRSGVALPILGVFLEIVLSSVFAQHDNFKRVVSSEIGRKSIDVAYWLLPKHAELDRFAESVVHASPAIITIQLWCTLAYTLTLLVVSILWLERKAF